MRRGLEPSTPHQAPAPLASLLMLEVSNLTYAVIQSSCQMEFIVCGIGSHRGTVYHMVGTVDVNENGSLCESEKLRDS